jgi:hypothetical protein
MNLSENKPDETRVTAESPESEQLDLAVQESLKNFRLSVHAWSDVAYSRPRTTAQVVRHRSWRLAAGWAMAGLLVVGGVSGGLHERNRRELVARVAAAERVTEQQRLVREQQAKEEEDLLANVDSDVSRGVPSAMEPLAQLMDDEAK